MNELQTKQFSAFSGTRRIACGDLRSVVTQAKELLDQDKWARVVIFDDATGELLELDFRGTLRDVLRQIDAREANETVESNGSEIVDDRRGPGRPRLGVVAREVTLLPRHWDWLATQPGGTSVALRKLVEQARLACQDKDRIRQAQEATYRFMNVMAGNEPGFEEATRALFALDAERFQVKIEHWPDDIREYVVRIAGGVFEVPR